MERISVNLTVLGINSILNYSIPSDMCIAEVVKLIIKTLSDEYPGVQYDRNSNHFLIHSKTGQGMPNDRSMEQLGIHDGESFILM